MKLKKIWIVPALVTCSFFANAQLDIQQQLNEIPPMVTEYVDYYFHDLAAYQGAATLNNMSNTANVLDQWRVQIGLQLGVGAKSLFTSNPLPYSNNFEIRGGNNSIYQYGPNMFGTYDGGDLFFRFIDPYTNRPVFDPFTGDKIGFKIPILPGLGTVRTFAPSVMPKISLGLGYGTEISIAGLPGVIKAAGGSIPADVIDLDIDKDMNYAVGIKHDVFHWVKLLSERNYHLSVGVNYASSKIGIAFPNGTNLFENDPDTEKYYTLKDNFERIDYSSGVFGIELMATKEFKWIDLSLFGSMNSSNYSIISEGVIDFNVNTSFNPDRTDAFEAFTVGDIINVNNSSSTYLFGGAAYVHLGGFGLGLKYGHSTNAMNELGYTTRGANFISGSISVAFGGKKAVE